MSSSPASCSPACCSVFVSARCRLDPRVNEPLPLPPLPTFPESLGEMVSDVGFRGWTIEAKVWSHWREVRAGNVLVQLSQVLGYVVASLKGAMFAVGVVDWPCTCRIVHKAPAQRVRSFHVVFSRRDASECAAAPDALIRVAGHVQ